MSTVDPSNQADIFSVSSFRLMIVFKPILGTLLSDGNLSPTYTSREFELSDYGDGRDITYQFLHPRSKFRTDETIDLCELVQQIRDTQSQCIIHEGSNISTTLLVYFITVFCGSCYRP